MGINFTEALGYLVRKLIRQAYGMPANSVRPANQAAPTGAVDTEFATVLINTNDAIDFQYYRNYANEVYPAWDVATAYAIGATASRASVSYICTTAVTGGAGPGTDAGHWATTANSTNVVESVDSTYMFTASVQFFRHATPAADNVGLSPFGTGAFDKAARLESVLALTPNLDLMDTMGLGLEDVSTARNLSGLVDGAVWEDRGSVDLTFTVVNRESVLLSSFASAEIDLLVQQQGGHIDESTIEVTQ